LFRLGTVLQRFMMRHTKAHCVEDDAKPADATVAIVTKAPVEEDGMAAFVLGGSSAYDLSLLTLPPLTEEQVNVELAAPELEKYTALQQQVRDAVGVFARRGRLQARMLWVLRLVDQLRRAAIDPSYVSDLQLLGMAVGNGAAVLGENTRRGVVPVEVRVFQAAVLVRRAARGMGQVDDATRALAAAAPAHVADVDTSDALVEALEMMCGTPMALPECAVCMDDVMAPVVLRCGHFYCRECLLSMLSAAAAHAAPACPSCRRQTLTDAKTQLIFPEIEAEAERRRAAAAAEKAAADAAAADAAVDAVAAAESGADAGYGPKVRAAMSIVRRVLAAPGEVGTDKRAPANKIVIASSFPAALRDLQRALSREGIAYSTIDATSTLQQRGRMLAAFQSDEGTAEAGIETPRVCLLSMRVGNAGLTLTAANHLIVLEPGTHSGDDAQLMGRLHRMGQRRPVTVHRLVTAATVEAEIAALSRDGAFTLRATAVTGGGAGRGRWGRYEAERAVQQRLHRILRLDLVADPDAEAMMGFEAGFEAHAEALGVLGAGHLPAPDDDDHA
jgi:SNF2 family DNA or RNA helicase